MAETHYEPGPSSLCKFDHGVKKRSFKKKKKRNVASQGTPSKDSGLGAILFVVCSTGNWGQIKQYLLQSVLSLDHLIVDSFSSGLGP